MENENKTLKLCFGIHNHQPVGNFGWVLEDAAEKCYLPFLDVLKDFPSIRVSIHTSGPLLDWIEENKPEYVETLASLVEKKQVEILGGGYYEPILTMLPRDDALEQLALMKDWAKKRLGANIRGIWLTERIWEPSLPLLLSEAEVDFTICDTTHFQWAGLMPDQIKGYFITEKLGATTTVFPIDRKLRYTIPFHDPEDTRDILLKFAKEDPGRIITYADDGEKFGVWPGTYNLVFEREWLRRFFTELSNYQDLIRFSHFSEIMDTKPPQGRVMLPTASYLEMTQWALPSTAGYNLEKLTKDIKGGPDWDRFEPFLRGGFWDNFLVKYPESNRIHKKMLRVSEKVSSIDKRKKKIKAKAKAALFRGQCNCAYWHGLFGGLYLNYLRDALTRNLIMAENIADNANFGKNHLALQITDFDCDGFDQAVLENDFYNVVISPANGASVSILDLRKFNHSITNVLTRRPEAYHEAVRNLAAKEDENKVVSIHDIALAKEEGLAELLIFDNWDRQSFQDHFFDVDLDINQFSKSLYPKHNDFIDKPFELKEKSLNDKAEISYERKGIIYDGDKERELSVTKKFTLKKDKPLLKVSYTFTAGRHPINTLWACESNFTLLTKEADDRKLVVDGKSYSFAETLSFESAKGFSLIDQWQNFDFTFVTDNPGKLWTFPVETVNQSEGGFERTYQGTSFTLLTNLNIEPGNFCTINFSIEVKEVNS